MANAHPPPAHRPPMWLSRSLSVGPSAASSRSSGSTARTLVGSSSHPLSDTPAPVSSSPPPLPRRPSASTPKTLRRPSTPPLPRRPSAPPRASTVTWTSSTSTSRPRTNVSPRPSSPLSSSSRSSHACSSSSHTRSASSHTHSSSHAHSSSHGRSTRRASPSRKKINLAPPPLEPDVRGKLGRHRSYALRDYLSARRRKPRRPDAEVAPSVASGYEGSVESFADSARETPGSDAVSPTRGDGVTVDPPAPAPAPAGDATPTRARSAPGTPTEGESAGPEPATLARRIQGLLSAPASAQRGADTRLAALLGDARVMAGAGRHSVFAALDRLRFLSLRADAEGYDGDADDDDDGSSIMLYGPLEPEAGSEAEIARSDVVSVTEEGETVEYGRPARPVSVLQFELFEREEAERMAAIRRAEGEVRRVDEEVQVGVLEVEVRERKAEEEGEVEGGERGAEAVEETSAAAWTMTWFESWKGKVPQAEAPKAPSRPRKKLIWVPSPDKVSLQATWWGYRLYLPPPVLDVLNNKRLEAAKRAALITAALKWLLDAVPVTIVPPQFRAGLLIAQQLAPYIGYVGGFMAWSWGAIKSFDKGYGVVLTATWLLPVALIPGTWEASDFVQPDVSDAGDATEREATA